MVKLIILEGYYLIEYKNFDGFVKSRHPGENRDPRVS